VTGGEAGNYGWFNRLSYDNSLTIVLEKEPGTNLISIHGVAKFILKMVS
jgi:hypothetical protein